MATSDRFAGADANHDGMLSPTEFAATASNRERQVQLFGSGGHALQLR